MANHHRRSGITDFRYQRRNTGAWERFVQGGSLPPGTVREVVERSWARCRWASVDPARAHAPDPLAEQELMALRQRHRELLDASAPIMAQARDLLSESRRMMILTDPTGVIIQTEGNPGTLEAAGDVRLIAGASWNELASGTNAIGAAVSLRAPARVHAAEHFCAGIKQWTCSATPVRDPATGELLGVLDISGLQKTFNRHVLALAMSSAGHIADRLKVKQLELRQRLLEWGLEHVPRAGSAGLLVYDRGGRLTAADARARTSLARMGLDVDVMTSRRLNAFSADSGIDLDQTTLPEWLRAEWIEPVIVRGERLGTIVVLPGTPSPGTHPDDRFAVASIAHEVKQPLAAVVMNAGASLRWLAQAHKFRKCALSPGSGAIR